MQSALGTLGYYEGAADGVFDGSTRLAVRRFQQAHGLEETGLADEALQALLFGGSAIPAPQPTQYIPRFPGAGRMDSPPLAAQVLYADWDSDVSRSFQAGQTVTLYDFQTGLAWQARLGEAGAAADAEPLTEADTEVMFLAFGGKNTWTPKPVWALMPDGRVLMASVHNMALWEGSIADNGFDGCFQIYFPRTAEHVAAAGDYAGQHQACLDKGWALTQAMR